MATKLYFHNAVHSLSGTLPTSEQNAAVNSATASSSGNTLRTMNTSIGAGQSTSTSTTEATTLSRSYFMGYFTSLPLSGNQTVGGGNVIINWACSESNTNVNINSIIRCLYVWRPSTGAKINIILSESNLGATITEPAASTETAYQLTSASSAVSALDGDVIVFEMWYNFSQGMGTAYNISFYYDGATDTASNTTGTTVSDHASYVQLTENLTFQTPAGPTTDGFMSLLGCGS